VHENATRKSLFCIIDIRQQKGTEKIHLNRENITFSFKPSVELGVENSQVEL
jgi:hypothetical protein